jgi:hypothetical protein
LQIEISIFAKSKAMKYKAIEFSQQKRVEELPEIDFEAVESCTSRIDNWKLLNGAFWG